VAAALGERVHLAAGAHGDDRQLADDLADRLAVGKLVAVAR